MPQYRGVAGDDRYLQLAFYSVEWLRDISDDSIRKPHRLRLRWRFTTECYRRKFDPQPYSFQQMVAAVSAVMGVEREEIRTPERSERVKRSREMLCYIARRHGEVELQELARFLQVKELSTASHAVRRAKARLKNDSDFGRRVEQVLKRLGSSIQPDSFYSQAHSKISLSAPRSFSTAPASASNSASETPGRRNSVKMTSLRPSSRATTRIEL